ncbi:hypothetical protein [Bradyrhizobium japonicum]|jgi:hypothetical protein|uniref:hypothetical protein n=1 Tax=Bradyrhizobium japonicum TaxID=375 RepID=UPI0004851258|nr:hypothetical protein [Bradyrhizobium japonicum]
MVLWNNFDAGDPQAECQRDHGVAGFVISHAENVIVAIVHRRPPSRFIAPRTCSWPSPPINA